MVRGKRERAGHRGGDPGLHRARGSDGLWDAKSPEDDPLRDLRPEEYEDVADSAADEFVWPDLHDESEEDD